MWEYKTPGIPDEYFLRSNSVPITKEEIRSIQISKARLCTGQIVYDVGCGSGSLSVESALQIGDVGKVYAIDLNPDAIELTKRNIKKFQASNISTILGNAKDKISSLPKCDAIFIGGSGSDTEKIVELCYDKLKIGGRIVIGTILIETLFLVFKITERLFKTIDVIQITISKSSKTSTGTMLLARNPVTIISATK